MPLCSAAGALRTAAVASMAWWAERRSNQPPGTGHSGAAWAHWQVQHAFLPHWGSVCVQLTNARPGQLTALRQRTA